MKRLLKGGLRLVLFILAAATFVAAENYVHESNILPRPHNRTIIMDLGGSLFDYIKNYSEDREAGVKFAIDGMCVSACTMILGNIPPSDVCITPYAKLGFHAAFVEDEEGNRHFSAEGTSVAWMYYPPLVQDFLRAHGWKSPTVDQPTLIWMDADDLRQLYQFCP